jgi:3'-5' exonuclease
MFKSVGKKVWVFDLEWVPDPQAGRRVYNLPSDLSDWEVIEEMYRKGGATEDKPRPYLKTVLCRIVSLAAVIRSEDSDEKVTVKLTTLPKKPYQPMSEYDLISTFLNALGDAKARTEAQAEPQAKAQAEPQLVGFNSGAADLRILIQRGIATGVTAPKFCKRPNKPWEGIDYFDSKYGEAHIDLKEILGGWGKTTPSLHELAAVSGIPGKIGTSGKDVVDLWREGKIQEIVEYNQFDALTTYLVWLRTAFFAGFFSKDQYNLEQQFVKDLLEEQIRQGNEHFVQYLECWERIASI